MEVNESHITYQHQGRFFSWGDPNTATHLLFALHGYGELAAYFIRKFKTLPDNFMIICPEAPHRFYQAGSSGRVGASWMTKEDRLVDIENYIAFLDETYTKITGEKEFQTISLLGFSQGGATASRWIGTGHVRFNNFLLWAAVFPPDMPTNSFVYFKNQRNFFVIGTKDEYTTIEEAENYHSSLNNAAMPFEFIKFDGNHMVNVSLMQSLIQ